MLTSICNNSDRQAHNTTPCCQAHWLQAQPSTTICRGMLWKRTLQKHSTQRAAHVREITAQSRLYMAMSCHTPQNPRVSNSHSKQSSICVPSQPATCWHQAYGLIGGCWDKKVTTCPSHIWSHTRTVQGTGAGTTSQRYMWWEHYIHTPTHPHADPPRLCAPPHQTPGAVRDR